MNVYVVVKTYEYEGAAVVGVFTKFVDAEAKQIETLRDKSIPPSWVTIEEWGVDNNCGECVNAETKYHGGNWQ